MKDDTILKIIPTLNKADLKVVKALIDKRLAGETVEDENAQLVVRLLNEMLGCKFTALRPGTVKNCIGLVSFVKEMFPHATKVQHVGVIKLCLWLIIQDLKGRMPTTVTPGAVLLNLVRMRQVFDAAFPDYRNSGMAEMILKAMIKR